MMGFLTFTFASFWHWLGMFLLIGCIGSAIGGTIAALRGRRSHWRGGV